MSDTHFQCECMGEHDVTSDEEWRSLNSFRLQFKIKAYIMNRSCPDLPAHLDPESIHAETLHMMLIERTW